MNDAEIPVGLRAFVVLTAVVTAPILFVVWLVWTFDRTPQGIEFQMGAAIWHAVVLVLIYTGIRLVVTFAAAAIAAALTRRR